MEHFYTLQGEGHWAGTAAYFIRLAGCDVGCVWCDVKESWNIHLHQITSLPEILAWVRDAQADRVVITGGEPAQHNLGPLTQALRELGVRIHIETSGTAPLTGTFDWVCLSPKKFKPSLPEWYACADELKVIVYNSHDFRWAQEEAAKCPATTELWLQPEWSRMDRVMELVDFVKAHPAWRLSLQTHKFIEIP